MNNKDERWWYLVVVQGHSPDGDLETANTYVGVESTAITKADLDIAKTEAGFDQDAVVTNMISLGKMSKDQLLGDEMDERCTINTQFA